MQGVTSLRYLWHVGITLGTDAVRFGAAWVRSRTTLAAENLFFRVPKNLLNGLGSSQELVKVGGLTKSGAEIGALSRASACAEVSSWDLRLSEERAIVRRRAWGS